MPENTLATLRDTIRTLRALHKDLKAERRQLVQVVADGVEIEMVAARVGFAIRQLQDARDLLSKLRGTEIDLDAAPVSFTTDWRGADVQHAPLIEPEEES